ncbi:carboxymuconolactone decarboxylase family protein [Ancylobacter sp. WKF20]|uniref:carboxymuconolactone decarboxylase family protein n=1 Tax=Ancylobacter sp. WKF20 TaxID=3039801 RepID=UPI0024343217|nr:carboxymuconolactone decarboxylase family protein [Ancylobacter sp. WKF20]WGD29741.1 carboxymuconolactone decarboxylase family protein [Ancylobacter sp. WKF20]
MAGVSTSKMPRIAPARPEDLPAFRDVIAAVLADHGYIPNSFLTMGREPAILRGIGICADAFMYVDTPPDSIRRLVSFAYSFFAGAMYSTAHTGCSAAQFGVPPEKLRAVPNFETSPLFDEAERAALRLCRAAARKPAEVTDRHLDELGRHFNGSDLLRIVGIIAWHAFLNSWNDICGTALEPQPRAFAEAELAAIGWHICIHD